MDATKTRAKTRALKKYEAAAVPYATVPGEPPLNVYSPFGPLIAQAATPQVLIDKINRYADSQVRADVSSEFLVPKELVVDGGEQSLAHHTKNLISRYLGLIDEDPQSRIRVDVVWVVSQYADTPSPVHFHSCDISGVLYLKLPELAGEADELAKTYISGRHAGYINFLIGGKQRFAKSLISFRPRIGDFYVFPGWLLHGAEPFRGTGERRSLAFNAFVDAPGV